jgi:DNA-directed RNA polymerase specialized sigma24 family protein
MALRELGKKSRQLTDYLEEATDSDTLAVEGSAEQELIAQQKLQQCCRAIADLPEQCRRVFLLRKIHAYSHKDIAAAPGTTSSNTSKASSPQKSSS